MSIQTICFDLDGTLVASHKGIIASMMHAIAMNSDELPSSDLCQNEIGTPIYDAFSRIVPSAAPCAIGNMVSAYQNHYDQVGIDLMYVFPGIDELLSSLMQRELYRVIVTSKPTNVANTVLRRMGLSKFFELVIGGDGGPKSNLLSKAIAVTHSHPSQTLMIGDRKYDVDAALNCGAHSIAVAYGYGKACELTSATAVVGTVDELGRTIDLLIA